MERQLAYRKVTPTPERVKRPVFLNPRAEKKLKKAFDTVDINGDGTISWEEIRELSRTLNIVIGRDDYLAFVSSDTNNDKTLDFEEFYRFATTRLRKIFNEIDKDKNGKLDEFEVQQVLEKLSLNVSLREVESILQGMDKDGDTAVDFDEFCEFFADIPTFDVRTVAGRWLCGIGLDVGMDQIPCPLPPFEIPVYRFMFAGGFGVAMARTFVAPLEKVKILSQVSNTGKLKIGSTFSSIFSREGVRGLWAGNLTNCIRLLPNGAIVGLVYSNMIKYTPVDNIKNPHQPLWRFFSGTIAGIISNAATFPLDVVRTKLTVQDNSVHNIGRYTGIVNTIKRITAEEGFRGLYKGMTPALISIGPFIGIQQSLYDVLKIQTTETKYGTHPVTFLTCGALAGTVAQTIIHPLEVIRRCMQVEDLPAKTRLPSSRHHLFRAELQKLRAQGLTRFYAGWTASCLKIVPSATISLLVRDALLGRLSSKESDSQKGES